MAKKIRKVLWIVALVSFIVGLLIFFLTGGYRHNILPLISTGEKYLGEEKFSDAELVFSRAISISPKTARAFYGRARADIGLGKEDSAIADFNLVSALAPGEKEKMQWMIGKVEKGEGDEIILLPYRDEVTSDEELKNTEITSDDREIAVVLDTSGSMDGQPLAATQQASKSFIHKILQQYADIGIVTFNDDAETVAGFTMNESLLGNAVDNITAGGDTATATGLTKAYEMLKDSGARQKIIVLMSDGESHDDPSGIAQTIRDAGITIYTLGFFNQIGDKASVQAIMENLASEGCHYEVDSQGGLQQFFDDIASQINGQKYYYIRIACPVDVSVRYKGEKLDSDGAAASQRTSFGSLTFEDPEKNDNSDYDSSNYDSSNDDSGKTDQRIKVLRLKEGADYDISIKGNGRGRMDYTIGFMDSDGEYSDMRKFKSVPITGRTEISTIARDSKKTLLNVDTNGDGKTDERYAAGKNGTGEIVDYSRTILIISGVAVLLILFIIIAAIVNKRRKNKGR